AWRPGGRPDRDSRLDRLCHGRRGPMKLSDTEIEAIQHEMTLYEDPGAACIDALKIVQDHRGWVSDEALHAAADVVGVTATQMEAVATFYNLIFRQPVGRNVIMI